MEMSKKSEALKNYLIDFYNDPKNVENYKITFIKNHYFTTINSILKCNFKDFRVGMSRFKNIIWFCNIKDPEFHVMYDHINDLYYIKNNSKKPYNIKIEDYINKKNEEPKKRKRVNSYENHQLFNTCLMGCNAS